MIRKIHNEETTWKTILWDYIMKELYDMKNNIINEHYDEKNGWLWDD